jgi:hypothetical protein
MLAASVVFASFAAAQRVEAQAQLCVSYAVEDLGAWDSQLVRSDLPDGTSVDLGPVCDNCDIEALALSPDGRLFGVSGGGGSRTDSILMRGDLFEIDKNASPSAPLPGGLTIICNTGARASDEIVGATFRPGDTDFFWASQEDLGLVTVDIFDCTRVLQYALEGRVDQFGDPVGTNWEGLAWDLQGRFLYGSDAGRLYRFDSTLIGAPNAVQLICDNISPGSGDAEALEFTPDGRLIGAQDEGGVIEIELPTDPASFGPDACTITDVSTEIIPGSPRIDVESIEFEACPGGCGNGVQEGTEECDGTDDDACPGNCQPDCTCTPPPPDCGNNEVEGEEECDGTDDDACPGNCQPDCTCTPPPPDCGNNEVEGDEECDGTDNEACLGAQCLSDCTCAVCGDGVVDAGEECEDNGGPNDDCCTNCQFEPLGTPCDGGEGTCDANGNCEVVECGDNDTGGIEECDGTDDAACPGRCQPDCTCAVCGDGVRESPEECDGADDANCSGAECLTDCTCAICGDETVDPGEQCEDTGTPNDDCCTNCQFEPVGTPCDSNDGLCDANGNCEEIVCGDNEAQGTEECDGTDDLACPGKCRNDCTCGVCGDGQVDNNEECDTTNTGCAVGEVCSDCLCTPCGNGTVDPGEQCDPPNSETCDNFEDDDNDGLIDCHDPDCGDLDTEDPVCSAECQLSGPCQQIKRDPAIIQFNGGGLDFFSIHGRVDAVPNEFDPTAVPFSLAIINDTGIIHTATLPAGVLQQTARRRWAFKDYSARNLGENSMFDGIYRVSSRFRRVCGQPSYTFKWRVYADMSEATVPWMTIQVYGVNELGSVSANWTRTPNGWQLKLSNLGDPEDQGTCR